MYREATEHRIAGRTEQSVTAYQAALALNGEHEDALYYVGNMYRETGRDGDAKNAWSRLVEVNPQSARGHSELADLHFCLYQSPLFDLDVAETEVRRALEINQEETGPLLRLGQIALVTNDLGQANSYLDQVIGSNFSSVEAHYLKGYVAWKSERREAAVAAFRQAAHHARPTEPVAGVLGEGDTKPGAQATSPNSSQCRTMPVPIAQLSALDVDRLEELANESYRTFDVHLLTLRQEHTSGTALRLVPQ